MRASFLLQFWLLLLCALAGRVVAATQLLIVDESGMPLQHAVVELQSSAVKPIANDIAIMDQIDKAFVPFVLAIQPGQEVSFPNSDDIRHHVYSFSQTKPFELKLYSGTPNQPLMFEKAGIVVLGCNIHDSMVGYIYVAEQPVLITDAQGLVNLPDNIDTVMVWHPYQNKDINKKQTVQIESKNSQISKTIEITTPAPRNTFGARFGQHE
ncbi:methylamine utilization protein [Pseudoalteromonas peptidolytica]|uniref:methylamine utilization protein n=1 Tax=Pseudoalteromonas peptidolytica TaxID=61150 RepID=UPI00298E8DE6|nr:methylamine utilization protein [Pseudoalteromonas peptidolytica]MDW7550374.1 methylamine utilization protein [Pseudoalteromonas peptidolytica]